ncbi:DUF2516 family protein [Streptomyces sp. NPDC058374]|uniref:DUF2516 family protein n=1 Tax=unclassified Streptomyces TaxID=2593676 RepID=UPI003650892D
MLIQGFNSLLGLLQLAFAAFAAFAFIDAVTRREDAFRAASKQSKPFWLIVLGIALVVSLLFDIISLLPIIGLIAVIVYTVDVRPAVREISGGPRRGGRGSSSDGPYGPYNGGR